MKKWMVLFLLSLVILAGCSSQGRQNLSSEIETYTLPAPSLTSIPTGTLITDTVQLETPVEVQTPILIETDEAVCMPFPDYSFQAMIESISNPYDPPPIGMETVHQGLDFAQIDPELGYAVSGGQVQSILGGRVVAVLDDRFPYGHAILVETPLKDFEIESDALPESLDKPLSISNLYCPEGVGDMVYSTEGDRSFYLMYAHLEQKPDFEAGDWVEPCTYLDQVGMSGNALNPHLHLEVRVGPADLHFSSMGHYDPALSLDEMANYCFWRVSGLFQFIDPILILQPEG